MLLCYPVVCILRLRPKGREEMFTNQTGMKFMKNALLAGSFAIALAAVGPMLDAYGASTNSPATVKRSH